MQTRWLLGLLLVFALSFAGMVGLGRAEAGEPRVVLVSIDGFAAYHLADESLELPHLRELVRDGVAAESSETVFPSVTHPSHTTMLTGVLPRTHGVIGNRLVNRQTGERYHVTNLPHGEAVRVPGLFDAAKARGFGTASVFWPESKDDPALDYSIPEVFVEESVFSGHAVADRDAVDPAYLAELRQAQVPVDLFFETYGKSGVSTAGDVALAKVAAYEIRTRQPELLAIHLVATDSTQHQYGSAHELSRASLTAADGCVGILREAVEAAGLTADTTFVITADHGFHTVEHQVNVYPAFREAGLGDRVAFHPSGWTLYVETAPAFDAERDGSALDKALEGALALPGVERIVRPEEFHALGFPRYEEDPHVRGQYMIIGDIDTFVRADPQGPSGRSRLSQASHGHGFPPDHPRMYPSLILSGRGIKSGVRIGHVHNLDIAPTVARLLDLDMEGLEGRVLEEALVGPPRE